MKPNLKFNMWFIFIKRMNLMSLCMIVCMISVFSIVHAQVTVRITSDNAYMFAFGTVNGIAANQLYQDVTNTSAGDIYYNPPFFVPPSGSWNSDGYGAEVYPPTVVTSSMNNYIYIITWSDHSLFQGVMAQFTDGNKTIYTGPVIPLNGPQWQVYATGHKDVYYGAWPVPDINELNSEINTANLSLGNPITTSGGWVNPTPGAGGAVVFGHNNTTGTTQFCSSYYFPVSPVTAIDPTAQWMWYSPNSTVSNPFEVQGSMGSGCFPVSMFKDYYIFRIGPINEMFDSCFAASDPLYSKIWNDVTYSDDKVWDDKMYIGPGVTVTIDGHMFDVTNVDVVFDQCAGINFINGGYLRANNSVFRPCWIANSWRGLYFEGGTHDSIIINECTFKNAEAALYLREGADARISDNLFANCHNGIRVEGNSNFNHSITGNQFVTDDYYPDFTGLVSECPSPFPTNYPPPFISAGTYSTYGIYSLNTKFNKHQLAHNEFVNSKENSPQTYGIFQMSGGGIFSENTFTDLYSPINLQYQTDYSCIENNEIEANERINSFPAIYVASCNGAIVDVNNNEIWNNYNQFLSSWAIYATSSLMVKIMANKIDGFNYGIYSVLNRNCLISSNEINNCQSNGILTWETTGYRSRILCNTIKMKTFSNSRGLLGLYSNRGVPTSSVVYNNCINDCYISMDFQRFFLWPPGDTSMPWLPKIRNNFLYNYNYTGINVLNMHGNIGQKTTPPDPGLNTLWSNKNTSTDIYSNKTIYVADNFGMFNIKFPEVQIVSNNPYHSTASCAQQIFNMPSQGQLNVQYNCDDVQIKSSTLTGSRGVFELSPDYRELLKASSEQYEEASMILANYDKSDITLLNEIIGLTTLSENEKALLRYNFYYGNGDYLNARIHMNQFNPTSTNEEDFKTLRLYDLAIIEKGTGTLSENDIQILKSYQEKQPRYANFATSILNNLSTYTGYKLDEFTVEDVKITGDIRHIEPGESFLRIYPNPVLNTVFVELVSANEANCKIELFDMTGKRVTEYTVNFVAGGLELDMQKLDEGLYFITLSDPTSGIVQKGKMLKVNY